MRTAGVVDLLGDEHLDLQLDTSSTAQDRRLLTSVVILPSDLCGLVVRMVETLPRGGIFWSGSLHRELRGMNLQVDMFAHSKAYATIQWLW